MIKKLLKKGLNFLYGLICCLAIVSCENDLKDIRSVYTPMSTVTVDKSYGVQIIYSDSAAVRAKMYIPQLFYHKTAQPYYEMPKGVQVTFYDKQQETSRIVSSYGLRREKEKLIELRKNVVATNREGDTFKSDELFWDENTRRFYSNKPVSITTKTETIHGTSFWANENFTYYEIQQSQGNFHVPEK